MLYSVDNVVYSCAFSSLHITYKSIYLFICLSIFRFVSLSGVKILKNEDESKNKENNINNATDRGKQQFK